LSVSSVSLGSIFWIFFRIACTSFGGFMAMISVIENVVVERKRLLTHAEMLEGISLASLLPGPVAVNVVTYVGYRLRGGAGALVAASAAILPAFAFVVALSAAYFAWGQIPAISRLFLGFIPAVTAIIVVAAWNMSRQAVSGWRETLLALAAAGALLGFGSFYITVAIILAAGVIGWLWLGIPKARPPRSARVSPRAKTTPGSKSGLDAHLFAWLMPTAAAPFWMFEPSLLLKLLLVFAGMSVMLFGGGYVFVPMIQQVVVDSQGWVTAQEFVDGIALGQVTPGPILVSAAFIGYKVAGFAGAVVATLGIFAPPALLMVAATHGLERIKRSAVIRAALRGIRPAVVGMIFAAAFVVGKTAAPVWISAALFAGTLYALLRYRVEAVWLIPASGLLGLALY
jgi:chromate transporter